MKYVIDSYAWLEYFMGTSKGKKVKSVIDSAEHEKLTPSICVAEVYAKALKLEGEEQAEERRAFMKARSAFAVLNEEIAVQAARTDVALKRSIKGVGIGRFDRTGYCEVYAGEGNNWRQAFRNP